jgi:DNA-binding transcriptional ArsR family regulator
MDISAATRMFAALSQETRLHAFRLLVEAGVPGMPAGSLSDALGIPHNTLSFHLAHLHRVGLVTSRKDGRSVVYSAQFDAMRDLIGFMVKDCCTGELASIREDRKTGCSIIELAQSCPPESRPQAKKRIRR